LVAKPSDNISIRNQPISEWHNAIL